MRVAPPVMLSTEQRKTLEQWARSRSLPIRQVQRAQIILLATEGRQDLEIATALNVSNQKAARWRKRFLQKGFAGLERDASRPGRTPTITAAKIQTSFGRRRKRNQKTRPTGVPEPWPMPRASAKRACAGSGINMA